MTTPIGQQPPTVANKPEPIKDGIVPHLRKVGDLINDLNTEIAALQRIEKALRDAHDRLERHTGLMHTETMLIEALLKRDRPATTVATPLRALPSAAIADKVEEDLARMITPLGEEISVNKR